MNRADVGAHKALRATIENRKALTLCAVENIVSFDETFVVLDSGDCIVTVDGLGLQIVKMDTSSGEVEIVGQINGLVYSDKKGRGKTSRLGGLFGQGRRQ